MSSSTGISDRLRKAQLAKGCEKLIPKGIRVSDMRQSFGADRIEGAEGVAEEEGQVLIETVSHEAVPTKVLMGRLQQQQLVSLIVCLACN